MKSKVQKSIDYGAEWRFKSISVTWPPKGSKKYYELLGFEKAIVWYQKYLKSLLKKTK